ncbi:gas vesicle protein GvpN [Planktothrix sp. FACHB-1365]|uniref:gas vesicle protein GvpN n=1 Tax=Planktothrix sp. FACHB-1365 TaxID=2692855 RepID=UPI0016877181|nr:gas vesicle protein GvpN [Planktothrix sp. FACHB-1365]MBD2484935.1 gas vesicle protein GvpN [Planktothrix sp. FACHB-1365]
MTTVLQARPKGFVNTPALEKLTIRGLRYLHSGFSLHLRGPAGTGKTTIAMHLADLLNRPIVLIFGDDELQSSDLIGNQLGYTRKKVVDNFIHSVVKLEDEFRQNWVDSRLTLACKEGFTLVYDEFNRSHPEANNVLLSALEEKLLVLPPSNNNSEYIRVHPHFRAILTSNPEEYCGVHATQDALLDRLITIDMPEPDEETQQEILVQKIGISSEDAQKIIKLIKIYLEITTPKQAIQPVQDGKYLRAPINKLSGLRPGLMISKICHEHDIAIEADSQDFTDVCADVLLSRTGLPSIESRRKLEKVIKILLTDGDTSEQNSLLLLETLLTENNDLEIEEKVYEYLQQSTGARVSEIEVALGLNRVQTTNVLRSLLKQGYLKQQDNRFFAVQKEN